MEGEGHPALVVLRRAREATIEHLSEAFARDELALEEFERRVSEAFAARAPGEFAPLLADLTPRAGGELALTPATRAADVAFLRVESQGRELARVPGQSARVARAILGNVERRGRFSLPRKARAIAVLGNVELDLRDVSLPPGVTELHVRAVFGNVELVVPPELVVEMQGDGILGSFSGMVRVPSELGDEPVLRVTGSAVFGNVEIRTLPRAMPLVPVRALPPKR